MIIIFKIKNFNDQNCFQIMYLELEYLKSKPRLKYFMSISKEYIFLNLSLSLDLKFFILILNIKFENNSDH